MLENQEMYHSILISDRDLAISSSKALTLSIIFSVDSLFFFLFEDRKPDEKRKICLHKHTSVVPLKTIPT